MNTHREAAPLVLKLGGELLEDQGPLRTVVMSVARIVESGETVVVVHGAGKEIDAALSVRHIEKQQVDGIRITDEATLDVVVAVLGSVNTRLVAALGKAGVAAVGLTGADGGCGRSELSPPHRLTDGRLVDLGRVGVPTEESNVRLLNVLTRAGFVPVIACIGVTGEGHLLNVNADTFASHLAGRLSARRLIISGTTPGVLDDRGATLAELDGDDIERLIGRRTATAGMVAKLRACEHALRQGAGEVVIVDGRDAEALRMAAIGQAPATATRVVLHAKASRGTV